MRKKKKLSLIPGTMLELRAPNSLKKLIFTSPWYRFPARRGLPPARVPIAVPHCTQLPLGLPFDRRHKLSELDPRFDPELSSELVVLLLPSPLFLSFFLPFFLPFLFRPPPPRLAGITLSASDLCLDAWLLRDGLSLFPDPLPISTISLGFFPVAPARSATSEICEKLAGRATAPFRCSPPAMKTVTRLHCFQRFHPDFHLFRGIR